MTTTPELFGQKLAELRARLTAQGGDVRAMAEGAFESVYGRDAGGAAEVVKMDDRVDEADLAIERSAVALLAAATRDGAALSDAQLRGVLTCVKVNNELERIADAASAVAESVVGLSDRTTPFPKTTRVMTNSVLGIISDTVECFGTLDANKAKVVLASEGAVLSFSSLILRDAEERVADGRMSVDLAFDLHEITSQAVLMADHCTNIAEQVIFEATGTVVRHREGAWIELPIGGSGGSGPT
ncbi:MAG: PhoU domain-containing protein [Phycisphaerales bacterium]